MKKFTLFPAITTKQALQFVNYPSNTMSNLMLILFAFSISTTVILDIPASTSEQPPETNCLLLATTAMITFFLAMILLHILLAVDPTKPISSTFACLIDYLAAATAVCSFATLGLFAIPNSKLTLWAIGSAIHAAMICLAVAVLYEVIRNKFTFCRKQTLRVAILTLCVGFAGLYGGPPLSVPAMVPNNSIIDQANYVYRFGLVPATFVMGTVLVIFGVVPTAARLLPFDSETFKESLTGSTLAVGITTVMIGGLLAIYGVLVNFGFKIGGAEEP